jgi:hypothetical protein
MITCSESIVEGELKNIATEILLIGIIPRPEICSYIIIK